ncbi:flocculation protein FLO11-like [Nicotiana sylvestris]|uniref:flocculation protein FLO11-like n=1 Tax=Nicotiana sylvestris TaxID=4096 RepID=UPI00388C54FF
MISTAPISVPLAVSTAPTSAPALVSTSFPSIPVSTSSPSIPVSTSSPSIPSIAPLPSVHRTETGSSSGSMTMRSVTLEVPANHSLLRKTGRADVWLEPLVEVPGTEELLNEEVTTAAIGITIPASAETVHVAASSEVATVPVAESEINIATSNTS